MITILFEAVVLFYVVHKLSMKIWGRKVMDNCELLALQAAVAGAIGHFLFEAFGVNKYYCDYKRK